MNPKGDPFARYARDPTAPKPQRDWTKAPWRDVVSSAATTLPLSLGMDTIQSLMALPGGVAKFADAFTGGQTTSPGLRAISSVSAVPYLGAQVRKAIGQPYADYTHYTPSQGAKDVGSVVDAAKQYVRSRYTDPGALKRTLATDPGSVAMDAQALASIPEGGEGLAARIPGVAGDLARGAVTTAKAINRANPVSLVGEGIAAAAKTGQSLLRGRALTKAGEFSPAAKTAITQAFPNGEITAAELANPKFREVLTSTFQAKGVNPAAAREAVLAYNGASPTRSATTGVKAPPKVMQATTDAVADAKRALAAKAQGIAGAPSPDPSALGAALHRAHGQAEANVSALYKQAGQAPGILHPVFADVLAENLKNVLHAENLPATPDAMSLFPSHGQSRLALDFLHDQTGRLAQSDELTFSNIERMRQELNALGSKASGNDGRAISVMKSALDQSVADVLAHSVPKGAPADFDASDFAKARAAYAEKARTFENTDTANPAVRNALKKSGAGSGVDASGAAAVSPVGADVAAQDILSRGFLHPSTLNLNPGAARLHGDLSAILDPEGKAALNDHLRQTMLQSDGGELVASPEQLRGFVDGQLGHVFTPEERSDIRLLAAGQDVLDAKLRPPAPSPWERAGSTARLVSGAALGAGAATAASHATPMLGAFSPFIEGAGAVAGGALERAYEGRRFAKQIRQELSGAPAAGEFLDLPKSVGEGLSLAGRTAPLARTAEGLENQGAPAKASPQLSEPIDLSTVPGPFDEESTAPPAHAQAKSTEDPFARFSQDPTIPHEAWDHPAQDVDRSHASDIDLSAPGPFDAPDGDRPERASGGRVEDIEPLVQRMMDLAAKAKRASNEATKPLLGVDDNAVAKALEIAQQAI